MARRGFTLVEMLLAIGILGIGVIAIASMFPVGLTQQRRSQDAIVGPTIANNAYATLRAKISPNDFGWFGQSGGLYDPSDSNNNIIDIDPIIFTIRGDTIWRRPAFFLGDTTVQDQFGNSRAVSAGSIDIFAGTSPDTQTELPYNTIKYGNTAPGIIISQDERLWPQQSGELILNGVVDPQTVQYVWDCAFRRFQGKMQVAIFVYRVQRSGASASRYAPAQNPDDPNFGPLPHRNLLDGNGTAPDDPWTTDPDGDGNASTGLDNFVPGTLPGDPLDYNFTSTYDHGWQSPGQWIVDQNNSVHRVLSGRRTAGDGPVELNRPVPVAAPSWVNSRGPNGEPVIALWYLPPIDANGWRITPVYATVRDFE